MATSLTAFFRETYEREHATTAKVLHSMPVEQAQFKPHERSNSAQDLAWTFVVEERMMLLALRGEKVLGSNSGANPPATWEAIIEGFHALHHQIMNVLDDLGDRELDGTVDFFTGPKQMGQFSTIAFLWFLLHDQIHHRGQLSIYLRMVGAKVPSIYGPSGDEPWN
ncbi:MAG TPA: DinB family protein [Thermoanaerobaculia bacterium]